MLLQAIWDYPSPLFAKFDHFDKLPFGGNFRDHLTSLTSGSHYGGLAKVFFLP